MKGATKKTSTPRTKAAKQATTKAAGKRVAAKKIAAIVTKKKAAGKKVVAKRSAAKRGHFFTAASITLPREVVGSIADQRPEDNERTTAWEAGKPGKKRRP